MLKRNQCKKGIKFEKKVQRTLKSGGVWFSPLDLNCGNYNIEAKYTDKKGYRITTELLEKIWGQALSMAKEPVLIVGIRRNEHQIFTLHCRINIEKGETIWGTT